MNRKPEASSVLSTTTHDLPDSDRRKFLRLGAAAMATLGAGQWPNPTQAATPTSPLDASTSKQDSLPIVSNPPDRGKRGNWPDRTKYAGTQQVAGMCQLCSTVCGIVGHIKDNRIIKIEGNPNDPNSRGFLCARGQAALNHQYHPERLLYPLKRVGARGAGQWKRISWDEALDEIAARLKIIRDEGKPEEFAFHQGRLRSKDAVSRFLKAFGTNTQLTHRALCSGNRRAANLTYLWESDWDLNDVEHSKYILNFGSNAFEAHQGHVPFANRIQNGRFKNGAKLVTFDVRLSNTAGNSDEWFCPFPGTDGAIALAMAHTILAENLHDANFINQWTNVSVEELQAHLQSNTPQWAESVSGVAAADIRRIAIEFANAAPACTTMCNRGTSAHLNGYYNDRAVQLLNAIVGSVGQRGGWCWSTWSGVDPLLKTPAEPPSPKTWSVLEDPPEYPLSNVWNRMRVGEIVYLYLLQGRAKLQAYMTYNLDSPLTWPEESLTKEVMCNEDLINFHVCVNCFYNETAHYADLVLPWTTYLERWDLDARASYNLRPYVGVRSPMVAPLGEARDIRDWFPELARRIGGGMEQWYQYGSTEDYMRQWAAAVPASQTTGKSGLDRLLDEGTWENTSVPQNYQPFARELSAEQLQNSQIDPATGIISVDGVGIGIQHQGKPVRGFATPSRKLEIHSLFVNRIGNNEDCSELIKRSGSTKTRNRPVQHAGHNQEIHPLPIWYQPIEHQQLADDELIMTSFKWNVHNHGRTMNLKWLAEIVHSNPAWLNPRTADQFGLQDGDWIEITSYFSRMLETASPQLPHGNRDESGRIVVSQMRVPIVTMPGLHPRAIAMSNSCGHWQYTRVARAVKESPDEDHLVGSDPATYRDTDWEQHMWWEDRSAGDPSRWQRNTGNGWNQNQIMPIAPDPITGQQAFHSTVVRIKKVV